ncbi:hypothetical protein [Sutcliffiella halmapala]|uniref:hypothetical protein n=1 Tax=Sutcliffiella halmapala TaxID=79882 RepID=UPI0009951171|nr:hypothetical protein [Sutcliffiella halmapala]
MGYLYYLTLVLYAVSIGFIGFCLFSFFVKTDKKKSVIGLIIGLVFFGAAMSFNKIPREKSIIVGNVQASSYNNEYACTIKEENVDAEYVYVNKDKHDVEDFCSQFEVGKEYKLQYSLKNDMYVISKVNP